MTFHVSLEILFIRETLLTNRTRKTDLNITMLSHIVSFQVMFSFSHKIAHTTLERVYIHISEICVVFDLSNIYLTHAAGYIKFYYYNHFS